jgi:hypothetical protein
MARERLNSPSESRCLYCGFRHHEELIFCPHCAFHWWEIQLINRRLNLRLYLAFLILYIAMTLYLSR